ncbi:MAG: hypothetical protein ACFFBP_22265 [Promethearchaeota archaeon]
MKEIGGFFGLELKIGKEYHPTALKLNSGRNALLYILKTIKPSKLLIPYYICNSVLEPIEKLRINYEFYLINDKFEPIITSSLGDTDYLLYVNYYGINDVIVNDLTKKFDNLIIDNSQAFFSRPKKFPTFYSPRKFFGVPDGAYLYINKFLNENLEQSTSYERCSHLLKRLDLDLQEIYDDYENAEKLFSNEPLRLMSKLTKNILSSINYKEAKSIREKNFKFLHNRLKKYNELKINSTQLNGPMKYPLLIKRDNIKQFLIENRIYISTYWLEVLERVEKNSFEYELTKYLLPLPIDQRYDLSDMNLIVEKLSEKL